MTGAEMLDPRVKAVWRLSYLVRAGVVAVLGSAVAVIADLAPAIWVTLALVLAYGAAAFVAPGMSYRRWSYAVREQDLVLRRGVLVRSTSIVPFSRIQHVDTQRGPIERAFGLSSVVVYTAGAVGAALVVPGLDAARADVLRDRLAALGAAGEPV
jgi:uncharacterized protein